MSEAIKVVAVDIDDALCLTEAGSFDLENTVLARMGRDLMSRSVHLATWGQPIFDAITTRSPGVDVEAFMPLFYAAIPEFIADGRMDRIPKENYQALDQLIAQGKLVTLLTSRTHDAFKHMLDPDHPLASRVATSYYYDNTRYHKPDPRAFNELLDDYGLLPNQCVYVGDSPGDAQAANQAGLYFVASLESGVRRREDFANHHVDGFINRFPEVVKAILQIEQGIKRPNSTA